MKLSNGALIEEPISMSSSFDLPPVYLGNIVNYSIQLVFTGTPVGSVKLQCSNDAGRLGASSPVPLPNLIVNWTDISNSSESVNGAGNHTWNAQNCGYLWVRVVYDRVSGTGNLISARLTTKGV